MLNTEFDDIIGILEDILLDPHFLNLRESCLSRASLKTLDQDFEFYKKQLKGYIQEAVPLNLDAFLTTQHIETMDADLSELLLSFIHKDKFVQEVQDYKAMSIDLSGILTVSKS